MKTIFSHLRLKTAVAAIALIFGLCAPAAAQDIASPKRMHHRSSREILTGFSGGMMVHVGYGFSTSPDELFRNASLKSTTGKSDIPNDGVTAGVGGQLRLHLLNHIHLGAEGGVSTMPLMKSGSNIRTGWGGAMCDLYWTWGKVSPLFGFTIGGGSQSRLYVPQNAEIVSGAENTTYNASFTRTPFFLLDPYIGCEVEITDRIHMIFRVDYMLPFGSKDKGLEILPSAEPEAQQKNNGWSRFIAPSGPKLYIGFMFVH
ncbi:MAG: hypothetical protein MJZ82_04520 [Paludibacteraceae bacterium]|nr:hypothetical protein [Paludibacteraceae bacterium]